MLLTWIFIKKRILFCYLKAFFRLLFFLLVRFFFLVFSHFRFISYTMFYSPGHWIRKKNQNAYFNCNKTDAMNVSLPSLWIFEVDPNFICSVLFNSHVAIVTLHKIRVVWHKHRDNHHTCQMLNKSVWSFKQMPTSK